MSSELPCAPSRFEQDRTTDEDADLESVFTRQANRLARNPVSRSRRPGGTVSQDALTVVLF